MTDEKPRDWDRELAEIDKVIASGHGQSGEAAKRIAGGAPPPPVARRPLAPAVSGTPERTWSVWLRVFLVLALAAAMPFYPYYYVCGTKLFLYMGAAGIVVIGGIWGAISSWRRRMGMAHTLSLLALLWGLGLVVAEVLLRMGYASQALNWMCP